MLRYPFCENDFNGLLLLDGQIPNSTGEVMSKPINVGDRVKKAAWVLRRNKINGNHPIARARGIVTSLNGGPFGDQYLEVKWSGTLLTYRYDNIHQLELAKCLQKPAPHVHLQPNQRLPQEA